MFNLTFFIIVAQLEQVFPILFELYNQYLSLLLLLLS